VIVLTADCTNYGEENLTKHAGPYMHM